VRAHIGSTMKIIRFQKVATSARIFVADNFVRDDEIERVETIAARPEAYEPRHDGTGLSFEMPLDAHPCLPAISARIETALGFSNKFAASFRYRRYGPGESHPVHCDNYEIGGLRLVATAMICLTACDGGGETRFPNTQPRLALLEPRVGRLAVWLNYRPDGSVDETSAHEGLTVRRGHKTTITEFVYSDINPVPAFAVGLAPVELIAGVRFE